MVKDVYGRSMNKTTVVIVILAILVVAAVGYIVVDKYNAKKQEQQLGIVSSKEHSMVINKQLSN